MDEKYTTQYDIVQRHFSELVFKNQEEGKRHNPYDQELREFGSIEAGDLERLQESMTEDYAGEVGILSKDPLRNARYLGIVVVTLASRAAMRGGLLPELAYSLSDSYMQRIDECDDIPEISRIMHTAEFQYAQMVREIHAEKEQNSEQSGSQTNPHIARCKDYISSHLHDKITLQDIADALALNANYLSTLFHKYEGITITSYIHRQKVDLAKNLLTYSSYSYIEIAAYLGYSSQSHLGKVFREITGYTLQEYRRQTQAV